MGTLNRPPARTGDSPRAPTWIDALATRLIARAARAAPDECSERLAEEWWAHSLALPAPISRFRFALSCCRAAMVISRCDFGLPKVVGGAPTGELIMAVYARRAPALFARVTSSDATDIVCEINTTPLIDIMLVLLVTLIIALPLMTHGVTIDLPHGSPPVSLPQLEVIDLDIESNGTVLWNGSAVPSMQQLGDYLRAAALKNPQPEIRLRPSPHVRYDYVAQVLALAQRERLKKVGFIDTARFQD